MRRSAFFLCLLLTCAYGQAQTQRMLGQNQFDTDILNQWWSYEDKSGKGACEMRILNVRPSEFEMNCVNWTKGFSGSVCSYQLDLRNDFFRLTPKACGTTINPGYIYGYMADMSLYLTFSAKALPMDSTLLQVKDWSRFSKIKR